MPVDFNERDARGFVRGRRTSDVADLDVGARVQLVDGDGELTGVADVVEVREKLLFFRVAWNTVRDLPRTLAPSPSAAGDL